MNKENLKKASTFLLKTTILLLIFSIMTYVPVLADTKNTYAEKGAKWILDGIFWCVIVAGIFGAGTVYNTQGERPKVPHVLHHLIGELTSMAFKHHMTI